MTGPHPYTLHATYTGSGCALCGLCGLFYDGPNHEAFPYWMVDGEKITQEEKTYWCCTADFGQHEPTCKNWRPE